MYSDVQSLANFFEGIGVLVQRGLINVDLVEDLIANRIIWWWEFFEPINKGGKEELGDPKLHDHTRLLYHEMKHRQRLTQRPEVK
jgi:hypothetical protein